ncbi:MAG: LysR family transcriptional regulator [Clostridiales bacterium]|jgi:DNA-binding transcriptional LysR family regulator|nr:LysR family transcriptional regulator [Eubacteriales bacterium]MDH7566569.1 LysR family transcriptional regulator [Clostridiales bacterium]
MDINFELYKIFYFAAKSENFSDAAEKLYISQSAVSQAIKSLEEKTGSVLFFRKRRRVKLTVEGQILFKHIEQAYHFIKTAENKLLEAQNLESGEIRIGASDTVCRYFLIPYLQKFSIEHPKVKIKVVNRTSTQITSILQNGMIDIGIVTLPVQDSSTNCSEFLTVQDIFVASPKYSGIKNRKIAVKGLLLNYPILALPQNSTTRKNLDIYLSQYGLSLLPEIELESIDLLVEFARIGLGVAHVLRESALNYINSGELFQVETLEKLPLRTLGIITVGSVPPSRAADEFIKLLTEK